MRGETQEDKTAESIVLDQLFSFIGSHPETAVSCVSFLKAVQVRRERSLTRKMALNLMKQLLNAAISVGGATHLVSTISSLIGKGL